MTFRITPGEEATPMQTLFICARALDLKILNDNSMNPQDPPLVVNVVDGTERIEEYDPYHNDAQCWHLVRRFNLCVDGMAGRWAATHASGMNKRGYVANEVVVDLVSACRIYAYI